VDTKREVNTSIKGKESQRGRGPPGKKRKKSYKRGEGEGYCPRT